MTYSVYLTALAEVDVLDTYEWYEKQQSGLGESFKNELLIVVGRVSENPNSFPIYKGDVRCARLKRFSRYSVYFSAIQTRVIIYAVQHSARNTSRLTSKLPFDTH